MDNPLGQMPQGQPDASQGPGTAPSGPSGPSTDPLTQLSANHDAVKAQYQKTNEVGDLLKATRAELDKLVALGPNVSVEDVMKGAGQILAAGGDETQLLSMIANSQSPMPQGGEALASWVKQQDTMVAQREAQFAPAQASAQHQLGVSAMHLLAGHALADRAKGSQGAMPGPVGPQPQPAGPAGTPPQGS